MENTIALDEIDLNILKHLSQDGRMSNVKLAKTIGMSPASTLERVKKLENSGVIEGYVVDINEQKIGIGITAVIQISLIRQMKGAIDNFRHKINEISEIVQCYQVTGNSDYILIAKTKDITTFEKLISQDLSQIEEIGQMHSSVVLSQFKNSKVLPLEVLKK